MTLKTNARIAGFTFLFYIAAGITSLAIFGRATRGEGVAAKLAGIAQNVTDVRIVLLLDMLQCFSALILGVTLYAITRDEDRDLALLGMVCRVAEGILGATGLPQMLGLLWLATASGTNAPDAASAHTLAAYFLRGSVLITATFFAAGSTLFCWLLLRGRMIPMPLAWLGVAASVLLVVTLPLLAAGFLRGRIGSLVWLPMLAFEVPFGIWLMIKGVARPAPAH